VLLVRIRLTAACGHGVTRSLPKRSGAVTGPSLPLASTVIVREVKAAGSVLQVGVLGQLQVLVDGRPLGALPPQAGRLLAMLSAAVGEAVSKERVSEYIASGSLDSSTVRTAVSRLRSALGGSPAGRRAIA
jgi:DNA-binding response OmpR family regulator